MRGRMHLDLSDYLDTLAKAGQNVDTVVADVLDQNKYTFEIMAYKTMRASSEAWTGAAAKTLFVTDVLRDGNYIYLELGADTSVDPAAWYKEYGRPNMKAEPWLRPTLLYYRRGGLRKYMQYVLEQMGLTL